MTASGDFIEVCEGALDPAICRDLIARFRASNRVVRGATGGGVETSLKDSWDLLISGDPAWRDAERALNDAMLRGLLAYLRKYPYCVLGPVWLRMREPHGGQTEVTAERIAAMDEPTLIALAAKVFRPGTINLQRYVADVGGYPRWHCEVYPESDKPDVLGRVLLWTLYLNDDFAEGETQFLHQQRKIAPRTGSLLIAPATWTHTHRGNTPRGGDKYIATSWLLFQRAGVIYGAPPSVAAQQ